MSELTKAAAAKRVKRLVPDLDKDKKQKADDDGKLLFKEVAVQESEVLSFKDYNDFVVVVTKDGKKLTDKKDK